MRVACDATTWTRSVSGRSRSANDAPCATITTGPQLPGVGPIPASVVPPSIYLRIDSGTGRFAGVAPQSGFGTQQPLLIGDPTEQPYILHCPADPLSWAGVVTLPLT